MDAAGPQRVFVSNGSSCREFAIIPLQLKQSQCVFGCWVLEAELYWRSWGFNWGLPAVGQCPINAISLPVDFLDFTGQVKRTQVKRSQVKRMEEDWQAETDIYTHTIQMPAVWYWCAVGHSNGHNLSLFLSFFSCLFPWFFRTRTCIHSRKWVAWLGDKAGIGLSSGTTAHIALFSISPINSSTTCSSCHVFFVIFDPLHAYWC